MRAIDELLARNRARPAGAGDRDGRPTMRVAIVACMDARLRVAHALGLEPGEAHVIRNAGGVVTDDVVRSLAISQLKLGTREIAIVQHTDCGMQKVTDEAVHAELAELAGAPPPFPIGAFADLDASVRDGVARVRSSPFIPYRDAVRGFVYEMGSGLLREVEG